MTIARAAAIASSTSGVGERLRRRRAAARPSTGPSPRARIMNSWNGIQRPSRAHPRADRARRTSAARARRAPSAAPSSASVSVSRAPSPRRSRALDADREVAVAEVEPHVDAELAQPVHDGEAVVAQAPAALVDAVGEPERAEVGVGADVGAVDLDVVGRCWRSPSRSSPTTSSIPRASFAPPVPPASTTTAGHQAPARPRATARRAAR